MKKLLLSTTILTLTACGGGGSGSTPPPAPTPPPDTTAPTITISGGNEVQHAQGTAFTLPSATVSDNVDSGLTATTSGATIDNTTAVGTYTITYSSSDAAGNEGTATLTVTVVAATTPPVAATFSQENLIASLVDNVMVPAKTDFANKTTALKSAIDTYCAALPTDANNSLAAAQSAWKEAMLSWQFIRMMQVGPVTDNNFALGNRVYNWPNNSTCAVDNEVVNAEAQGYDIATRTDSRKGLAALEYTLFNTELDHSCTLASAAPSGWNARADDDRKSARCGYSSLAADDLITTANNLLNAWTSAGGFAEIIKAAGSSGNPYADTLEAINAITDAMFYLTETTKDAKVGVPAGVTLANAPNSCGGNPCPEDVESKFAQHSIENVIANLHGFRALLTGNADDNLGFEDFLQDVGDAQTAADMITTIDAAITHAEGLNDSLTGLLNNASDEPVTMFNNIKGSTDLLKGQFIQSLGLSLPTTSAGDND